VAREIALSILTARDEALQAVERVEPPPMSADAFLALVAQLRRRVAQSRPIREAA
jgi:hypothetical protein